MVQRAFEPDIQLTGVTCHTDSRVALGLEAVRAQQSGRDTRAHHPTAGSTDQEFRIQLTFPLGVYPQLNC